MLKKKILSILATVVIGGLGLQVQAQITTTLAGGLHHPTKVITAADNSLLVSEGGTMIANTGRISVVDRTTGARQSLIEGLPSGVSNLGGPPDTDGTTGLFLKGQILYVTSGVGDAVINVGPRLELPNPAGASSPIFNSVIEIRLPRGYASLTSGFMMTPANQAALAANSPVVLTNAAGRKMMIRMVANLPDYRSEPRPGHSDNVRASHLFGVEMYKTDLYVVDAGFNLIHQIDPENGATATFAAFPFKPNPLFPTIGGPFIEPVPDNIHRWGNRLLVPLLTGFPFIVGMSDVQAVSLKTGGSTTLIPGLTSAIDVLRMENEKDCESGPDAADQDAKDNDPDDEESGCAAFYTLEFSTNQLGGAPGRLRFFSSADAVPVTVVPVVITPTSMAMDEETGDIFITNIFPGTVTRVQFP